MVSAKKAPDHTSAAEDSSLNGDVFLGMLGHDLRNPLAAILTSARLVLRRGQLPESELRPLGRIVSSGERMERMIDQILDMTRARHPDGIPLHREPEDVIGCVRDSVEKKRVEHPDVTLILNTDATTRPMADIDCERIEQVMSSLLCNAILHGKREAPVIVGVTADAEWVDISVHNSGPPISPERRSALFNPFSLAHPPKQPGSRGLGVGVYLADHIVRRHGGSMSLTSTEAEGTTFAFRLPRVPAANIDRSDS